MFLKLCSLPWSFASMTFYFWYSFSVFCAQSCLPVYYFRLDHVEQKQFAFRSYLRPDMNRSWMNRMDTLACTSLESFWSLIADSTAKSEHLFKIMPGTTIHLSMIYTTNISWNPGVKVITGLSETANQRKNILLLKKKQSVFEIYNIGPIWIQFDTFEDKQNELV